MNGGFAKATLLAWGLVVSSSAVCSAVASPTILLLPFLKAQMPQTEFVSGLGLETRIAAAIETAAEGRAHGKWEANRTPRLGIEFEADEVRALATLRDAAYVVVGRWLSPGPRDQSVDQGFSARLALRSGGSGATEFRYRLNLKRAGSASEPTAGVVNDEVEKLARAMLQDLRLLPGLEGPPAVGTAPEAAEHPRVMTLGSRSDFLKVSRDEPIEINSDELEVRALGSARQFTFTHHVHVVQGEMELFAGHMKALYPEGSSQPERLDAQQNVRMLQGDLEVHCHAVTYLRENGLVICRGDALLLQGCDEVRGQEIEFHLDEERVKVLGAASAVLRLEQVDSSHCERRSTG